MGVQKASRFAMCSLPQGIGVPLWLGKYRFLAAKLLFRELSIVVSEGSNGISRQNAAIGPLSEEELMEQTARKEQFNKRSDAL